MPVAIVAEAPKTQPPIRIMLAHPTNFSKRTRLRTQAIVIHATDGHEGPQKAEDVAAMFARPLAKARSAHFVVDSDSIVQCVSPLHIAWHCGPAGNARCEGVEICGRAGQTRAQWLDAVSMPTLQLAAWLVARRCAAYGIPATIVDRDQLVLGMRGITTHAEVSAAWKESKHTDPGPSFPLFEFVEAVRRALQS